MHTEFSDKYEELLPHTLLVKIKAVYDTFKTAEKKAVDFMLNKPLEFSRSSIADTAEAAGCSEATLVRLAKKLGYKGFPELKAHIGQGKDSSEIILYDGITEGDSHEEIIKKVFMASIQALYDTLSIVDKDEYKKAVDAVIGAEKIVFSGVGDAYNVAHSGYQKFLRIGANVQASSDLDLALISVSNLGSADVLIAISHSGETKSTIRIAKYAKETGAKIICITNYPRSTLSKLSDIVLLTAAFTEHLKGEVISKRVAQHCILESIFVNVLAGRKKRVAASLEKSNKSLLINKIKS